MSQIRVSGNGANVPLLRTFAKLVATAICLLFVAEPTWPGALQTPSLEQLPPPVRAYAQDLAPFCSVIGRHAVVVNEMYAGDLFGAYDINHDGKRDYFVYKCMFGCDGEPFAFVGMGNPCAFGRLLLSSASGYTTIPLPGTINRFEAGRHIRVAVNRQRIHTSDCDQFQCSYIFEFREGRFQLVRPCPVVGCQIEMSRNE